MNCKTSYLNGLCISIFLDKMGWLLDVIGKPHNDEYLIYIFTVTVEMVLQLYLIKQFIRVGIKN